MLQTVSKGNSQDRYTRTAALTSRPRHKISFLENQSNTIDKWVDHSIRRPGTTALTRNSNYNTLNQTGRSSNLVDIKSVAQVQSQLSEHFKEDMNSYLRRKLRQFVDRKKQTLTCDISPSPTTKNIQTANQTISSFCKPLQLYSIVKPQIQVQVSIDEAHLLNAKEKIIRLIEMKKQRQSRFNQLTKSIKMKSIGKAEQRIRSITLELKHKSIQEDDWFKEWQKDHSKENSRYRHRLHSKYNKNNNFFNISQ